MGKVETLKKERHQHENVANHQDWKKLFRLFRLFRIHQHNGDEENEQQRRKYTTMWQFYSCSKPGASERIFHYKN